MKFIFPTLIAAVALTAGCENTAPAAPPPPTEVMVAPVARRVAQGEKRGSVIFISVTGP